MRPAFRSSLPACRNAGYGEGDLAKICRENWLRVLRSAWHEDGCGLIRKRQKFNNKDREPPT